MISKIPDFEIETVNGKYITNEDLQNDKRQTYIEFWGTWCKGCIQILPQIKKLHSTDHDNLRIISLAYNDTEEEVIEFMRKNDIKWEVAIIDEEIREKFNQIGFPRGYLFNEKNVLLDYNFHPDEYKKRGM